MTKSRLSPPETSPLAPRSSQRWTRQRIREDCRVLMAGEEGTSKAGLYVMSSTSTYLEQGYDKILRYLSNEFRSTSKDDPQRIPPLPNPPNLHSQQLPHRPNPRRPLRSTTSQRAARTRPPQIRRRHAGMGPSGHRCRARVSRKFVRGQR
jgi:hypothetical protein